MDQVKTALAQLKKYHFWILCGFIAVVGLGSWYMTQSSLKAEFEKNKGEIDQTYTTVQQLVSQSNPPNPSVHQGMELRINDLQQQVARAWKTQYEHQKNTILTWPTELTRNFRNAVEPLRPIEEKFNEFPTPPEKELPRDLRNEYANYIEQELPKLAEVIGARWTATAASAEGGFGSSGSGGGPTYGGAAGYPMPTVGPMGDMGGGSGGRAGQDPMAGVVVDWNTANQGQLMAKFSWSKQPGGVPTTLQILYAQEDLWVLKNLMEIIKKTNDGTTERHKAYIRSIEAIQIGREAAGRTGQISSASAAGSGLMGSGMTMPGGGSEYNPVPAGGSDMPDMSSMGSGSGSGSGGSATAIGMPGMGGGGDPAQGRYVDKDYKPLDGSKIRSDVTTNPNEVYLAVAKRMPVRLICQMDQRKIHKLLAECGNSPLTVEVRQVRVGGNAGKGMSAGGGSYGGSSGGPGGMMMPGGGGGMMMPGGGGGSDPGASIGGMSFGGFGGGSGNLSASQAVNDIAVEIYGIVYIFNPVNNKALGIKENADGSTTDQPGALTADAGAANNPS